VGTRRCRWSTAEGDVTQDTDQTRPNAQCTEVDAFAVRLPRDRSGPYWGPPSPAEVHPLSATDYRPPHLKQALAWRDAVVSSPPRRLSGLCDENGSTPTSTPSPPDSEEKGCWSDQRSYGMCTAKVDWTTGSLVRGASRPGVSGHPAGPTHPEPHAGTGFGGSRPIPGRAHGRWSRAGPSRPWPAALWRPLS
jgi:hypothetical protein